MLLFLILYFVGMVIFAAVITRNSVGGLNALRELWEQGKLARVLVITILLGWPGFAFAFWVFEHDSELKQEVMEIVDGIF